MENFIVKSALTKQGEIVVANLEAPPEAICSHCGGVVDIRRRRLMDGKHRYYWRHRDNKQLNCQGRSRPIG